MLKTEPPNDFQKLLAVYLAFEELRGYENVDNWFAELRENDYIAIDYGKNGGVRVFASVRDAVDYFRAEGHLLRVFGNLPDEIMTFDWPSDN